MNIFYEQALKAGWVSDEQKTIPPQQHKTLSQKIIDYQKNKSDLATEQAEQQSKQIEEVCFDIGQSLKAGENIYNIFLKAMKYFIADTGHTAEYEQIKQVINKIYVKELKDSTAAECVYNLMLDKLNKLYYIKDNNSLTEQEDKNICKSIERYTQELCILDEIRKGES